MDIFEECYNQYRMDAFRSDLFTEANQNGNAVTRFFKNLVAKIKEAIRKIKEKVSRCLREKKIDDRLKKLKKLGNKPVEAVNLEKMMKVYENTINQACIPVNTMYKKYINHRLTISQFKPLYKKYDEILSNGEKNLKEIRSKREMIPANKVYDFIYKAFKNNELSNYEKSIDSLIDKAEFVADAAYNKAAQEGTIMFPQDFKEVMHNASQFVLRNSDLIISMAVSGWSIKQSVKINADLDVERRATNIGYNMAKKDRKDYMDAHDGESSEDFDKVVKQLKRRKVGTSMIQAGTVVKGALSAGSIASSIGEMHNRRKI